MNLELEYAGKFFVRVEGDFYMFDGSRIDWYFTDTYKTFWKNNALAQYPQIVFEEWDRLIPSSTIRYQLRNQGFIK